MGFGAGALALVVVGWRGVSAMGSMRAELSGLLGNQVESVIAIGDADRDVLLRSRAVANHILASDDATKKKEEQIIQSAEDELRQTLQSLIEVPGRTAVSRHDL